MFYADATDEMGELVEGLSDDAIAVARAIEVGSGNAVNLRRSYRFTSGSDPRMLT